MWNAFLDHEQLFTFEKKRCVSSASRLIPQSQHYLPAEPAVPRQCEIPQISQGSALPSSTPPEPLLCTSLGSGTWHKANYGSRVVQTYQGNSLHNGNLAQFLKVHCFPWEQSKELVPRTVAFPSHLRVGHEMEMSPDPVISQVLSNKQSRQNALSWKSKDLLLAACCA